MTKKADSNHFDTGTQAAAKKATRGHDYHNAFETITDCNEPIPGAPLSPYDLPKIAILEREAARREMAHELHDSVNPLLCVARIYLEHLSATTDQEIFAKKQALELISSAIENVKQVSYAYSILDRMNSPVSDIIEDLVNRIEKLHLFNIEFTCNARKTLDKLAYCYKLAIHRIIQEQLNNVIKYSKAQSVSVKLGVNKGLLTLKIADDGIGFDPKRINPGVGLRSIAKRIEQLGGTMHIESHIGKGCRLDVSFRVV